ncbi:SAM-dependent methyltransferase [Phenylobacterium hankyongense]|uniref:SAM-dependent methyltransferase n=1 Tax=Phenylobacterium hankyongense TaxID=1813876 RepID=A0A328B5D3_9CAUL|nr:class I SAM-dependent methyltransferase [Phenylobacterium hankyongense]RAK61775.1 SAM-dependent methyltransferase [Phenylobacterium hankyongense]
MTSAKQVHETATTGFGASAAAYAMSRPGYPAEIEAWLTKACRLWSGRTAVEIGAGTGKFTDRLIETQARVIAIEPVAAMRSELIKRHPDVQVLDGSGERIPLPDGIADAVLCAQSFHWFANAGALTEIRRVLKPGGRLGLVWNLPDVRTAWVARWQAILVPYEGDAPTFRNSLWRAAFPADGFGPLEEETIAHSTRTSPELAIVRFALSLSYINVLPKAERDVVVARLRALIENDPDLRGRDEVTVPWRTLVASCASLPPVP